MFGKADRDGPHTYTVPARQFTSCDGCKHFQNVCVMHGMRHNEYEASCEHPNFSREHGRTILRYQSGLAVHTPHWCPFLAKPQGLPLTTANTDRGEQ